MSPIRTGAMGFTSDMHNLLDGLIKESARARSGSGDTKLLPSSSVRAPWRDPGNFASATMANEAIPVQCRQFNRLEFSSISADDGAARDFDAADLPASALDARRRLGPGVEI